MKTLIIVLFLTIVSDLFAQVSGDYRSGTTSVTWSTASNWETYNGSSWVTALSKPGSTNSVYIQRGHTVTLTGNESCNDLHLNRDNNTTILALGTNTLNLNGKIRAYIGTVGTIPGTSSNDPNATAVWITSTTGKISVVGSTRTLTVFGEWGNGNAGASSPNGFDLEINLNSGQTATMNTFFKSRSFNVVTGTLYVATDSRMGPDQGTRNGSNFVVQSGATFISAATGSSTSSVVGLGDLNLGDTLWIKSGGTMILTGATPTISMNSVILDGTVVYNLSGTQNLADRTNGGDAPSAYTNLILRGSGVKRLTNTNNSVSGKFSIQDSATFSLNGNNLTYGASSTLEYASTNFAQTTSTAELNTSGSRVPANLLIKAGADVSLGNDVTFGNSCSFVSETGSTFRAGLNTLAFGTLGTVSIGGSFKTANVSGLSGGAGTTIKSTNSPSLTLAGSTIEYSSGSTQVITPSLAYVNMIISGAGTKTITSTVDLLGDLTLNSAVTVNGANLTAKGNISGTGSMSGTGSIGMSGSGKTLSGSLTLGYFTNFSSGTNTITGVTSIGILNLSTGTLDDGGLTIPVTGNIIGTANHSGTGKIQMTGSGKTISGASLKNIQLNNAGGFSLSGNTVISGVLTLSSGTLTVGANTLSFSGSSPVRTSGNIDASNVSSTVAFTNTSGIITLPASFFTGNVKNFTVSGSGGTVTIGQSISITGVATIGSGASLNLGSFNFVQSGTSTLAGSGKIILSGALGTQIGTYNTNTFQSSGTYEFAGALQSIPSGSYSKISINGSGTTIAGNVTLSGALTLTAGTVTLGANTLSAASVTGGSATSYIKTNSTGGFKITSVPVSTNVNFPVGNSTYNPVIINYTGTVRDWTIVVGDAIVDGTISPNNPTAKVNREWDITPSSLAGVSAILSLQWNDADQDVGFTNSTVSISHYNALGGGNNWFPSAAILSAGTVANSHKAVSTSGFTSFSPYAVANDGPLPVEMASFTSSLTGRNAKLSWTTNSETNNSGFDIERKNFDTESWAKVGNVTGAGTSSTAKSYSYTDRSLQTGKYNYRLKQIDLNGNYHYYDLNAFVEVTTPHVFNVSQNYPNPFNPTTKIDYGLPFDSRVTLILYDMTGREAANLLNSDQAAGYHTVEFNAASLTSGVYFYRMYAQGGNQSFIKTMKMLLIK